MQITLTDVSVDYRSGPLRAPNALHAVSAAVRSGSYTAVVGHAGSGKSTLLKVLSGLLLPRSGTVQIGEQIIRGGETGKQDWQRIRHKIGLVFQYPESQLFAETVEQDICFGPLNMGGPLAEAKALARELITRVGLDPALLHASPLSLSGGQKRRTALAGILAMQPEVLLLDEPGAGLDPEGKRQILDLIHGWHQTYEVTTILATQDIDDAVRYAEELIIMAEGRIVLQGSTRELLSDPELLTSLHVELPRARRLQLRIEEALRTRLPRVCLTAEELADTLYEAGFA